jgi:hypothetical protein
VADPTKSGRSVRFVSLPPPINSNHKHQGKLSESRQELSHARLLSTGSPNPFVPLLRLINVTAIGSTPFTEIVS